MLYRAQDVRMERRGLDMRKAPTESILGGEQSRCCRRKRIMKKMEEWKIHGS